MHSTAHHSTKIEGAIDALCIAPWLLAAIAAPNWLHRVPTSATTADATDDWIEGILSLIMFAFGSD